MGLLDSAKSLYDTAKEKATDALGEDGVEMFNSLKDSTVDAGAHLKRTMQEAVNNSDNE